MDAVQSGLTRLRNQFAETTPRDPFAVRAEMLDDIIEWLEPAVADERARWDAEDAALQRVKDRVFDTIEESGS
jgi:hypothetical protein